MAHSYQSGGNLSLELPGFAEIFGFIRTRVCFFVIFVRVLSTMGFSTIKLTTVWWISSKHSQIQKIHRTNPFPRVVVVLCFVRRLWKCVPRSFLAELIGEEPLVQVAWDPCRHQYRVKNHSPNWLKWSLRKWPCLPASRGKTPWDNLDLLKPDEFWLLIDVTSPFNHHLCKNWCTFSNHLDIAWIYAWSARFWVQIPDRVFFRIPDPYGWSRRGF